MQCWATGGLEKQGSGPVCSAACAPVITSTTPGSASARLVSMFLMRACAWGLLSTAAWAMFGRTTSSMYFPRPVSSRGSSTRFMLWPIQR